MKTKTKRACPLCKKTNGTMVEAHDIKAHNIKKGIHVRAHLSCLQKEQKKNVDEWKYCECGCGG